MSIRNTIVTALLDLLDSPVSAHRSLASRALGRVTSAQAVPGLIDHLWDVDVDVAIDAAEALGMIGDSRAEAPLCDLYEHAPLGELKLSAVESLGKLGGTRALALLLNVAALRDPGWPDVFDDDWDSYWDAQLAAIQALGRLGETRAARTIAGVLDEDSPDDLAEPALQACAGLGAEGIAVLLQRLREAPARERRTAARLLAGQTDTACRDALHEALGDADASVRAAAVGSLTAAGLPLGQEILSTLLSDAAPQVRQSAVSTIKDLPYGEHQGDWGRLLADDSTEVRVAAVTALGSQGDTAVLPLLVAALADPEFEVVGGAIAALGQLGHLSCVPDLAAVLRRKNSPADVRVAAVSALERIQSPDGDAFLRTLLADPEPAVRIASLHALARRGSPEFFPLLAAIAKGDYPSPEQAAPSDGEPSANDAAGNESATGDPAPIAPKEDAVHEAPVSTLEAMRRDSLAPATTPPRIEEHMDGEHLNDDERAHLESVVENLRIGEQLLRPRKVSLRVDLRRHALKLLGRHQQEETLAILLDALESTEEAVQLAALEGLAEIGDPKAKGAMLGLLRADSPAIRLAAIRGLRAMADTDVVAAVSDTWPDPDAAVRCGCVAALEHSRDERAGGVLRMALAGSDPLVAKTAAEAILRRGDVSALPEIVEAVLRNPDFNWEGLGRLLLLAARDQAPIAFLDILQDSGCKFESVRLAVSILEEMAPAAA